MHLFGLLRLLQTNSIELSSITIHASLFYSQPPPYMTTFHDVDCIKSSVYGRYYRRSPQHLFCPASHTIICLLFHINVYRVFMCVYPLFLGTNVHCIRSAGTLSEGTSLKHFTPIMFTL